MPPHVVRLNRIFYIDITVEADNPEMAKGLAYLQALHIHGSDPGWRDSGMPDVAHTLPPPGDTDEINNPVDVAYFTQPQEVFMQPPAPEDDL